MLNLPDLDFEFIHKVEDDKSKIDNAILLFHGLTGSTFEMKKYGQYLYKQGYDVYAYCLPGHGIDSIAIKDVTWMDWVNFSFDKLDSLKKKYNKVFLSGLCLGAVISLVLEQMYPSYVSGIISLSTTLFLDGWTIPWYNFLMPLGLNTILRFYYTFPEREPYGIKNESKRRSIQKLMSKNTVAMDNYPLCCVYELLKMSKFARKNMQKVKCPILIIHSKEDDLTSIKSAYNVYNNVSSLEKKIIILENSYHLMLYDNEKDRVYNESLLFLNNIISLGGAKVLRNAS